MQIQKIFHYHSQYYVHYKNYKGRQEERERVRKRNRDLDWLPRVRTKTKHNISKFPNPQNPKVEIETQTDYPTFKKSIHTRERVRHNERETEWNRDRTFTNTKLLQSLWSYLGKRLGIVLADLGFFVIADLGFFFCGLWWFELGYVF